jgi:hypothetical protein
MLPLIEHTGAVLEIESADGAKNILYMAAPEAYAPPPAAKFSASLQVSIV